MSSYTVHLDHLNANPVLRTGLHGREALSELSPLFSWLPFGDLHTQLSALKDAPASAHKVDREAAAAWAGLIRGHALDFYADAGQDGTLWQYAVIDAWETWLLIREGVIGNTVGWPWSWSSDQFQARGGDDEAIDIDPHTLFFGPADDMWKRTDISDWRRGLARLTDQQACCDALLLAECWPGVDMSSLGIALGALWSIAVPGRVVGAESLEIGGCRGRDQLIFTKWSE